MNGGYYLGSAISIVLASSIYDKLENFTFPSLIMSMISSALLIMNLAILPDKEKSVLSSKRSGPFLSLTKEYETSKLRKVEENCKIEEKSSCDPKQDPCDLTPTIVFPATVTFLLDTCGGYLLAIVSPYLTEVSGSSVSEGGVYVMVLTLSMSAGSVLSGVLMQRKVLSSTQLISLSALGIGVGLWLLFPGKSDLQQGTPCCLRSACLARFRNHIRGDGVL